MRIIEVEQQSEQLLKALEGLKINASQFSEAKAELQSASSKTNEFLEALKSTVQESRNIVAASKKLSVVELLEKQAVMQNAQEKIELDIKDKLIQLENKWKNISIVSDDLRVMVNSNKLLFDKFNQIEELVKKSGEQLAELDQVKTKVNNVFISSIAAIALLLIVLILTV